jgi:phage terminase large subunit
MGLWQNLENIKSLEGVKYCWVEEARKVTYDSWNVLIPTLRLENSQFFISFNPDQLDDPAYDMFITHEHPESLVIKINYNENPFLSETSKKEIEYMKVNKPDDYNWIYGGNCRVTSEARILHNITIHNFDIDKSKMPLFGLDFGYNDPNALTQSYIYDNELYICNEYYSNGLDPEELRNDIIKIEWVRNQHIVADSSQPAMIKLLNATGFFTVSGSRKSIGQPQKEGAYKYSMALYMKHFNKIHIHETNCPNSCREFTRWSWQTDKNDKILDIVQDGDDHSPDATIYAHEREAAKWYRSYILNEKKVIDKISI